MDPDLANGSNLVTNWSVRHKGKHAGGPFTDYRAATAAAQWKGDVVLGRNPDRKIVSYEIMFSRNETLSPRNPFDMAKYYRAQAAMHTNQFWSLMLAEAAEIIDALATDNLNYITDGNPAMLARSKEAANGLDAAPPAQGRKPLVEPPVAPISSGRRMLVVAPPEAQATTGRRRLLPPNVVAISPRQSRAAFFGRKE
jgi:hypothetical protein